MPGAVYVQEGKFIDYTPGSDVAMGEVVALGNSMIGIATRPITSGEKGALAISGVFEVTKHTAGNAATFGKYATISTGTSPTLDEDAAGGPHVIVETAAIGETTAKVLINAATGVVSNT